MNVLLTVSSSALVSALVSGIAAFLTQRHVANRKAQLDYELIARRKLYEAVGPLRLQLVLASLELIRRVAAHDGKTWAMDPNGYYARSFAYRILRPLAIIQLIEQQMAISDFTVDESALDLVQFSIAAPKTLSGSELLLRHPHADWSTQSQHLYYDTARAAARRLIVEQDDAPSRVAGYGEFVSAIPDLTADPDFAPLAALFSECSNLTEKPILWLRLVAYGHLCKHFVDKHGATLGIKARYFPTESLIRKAQDEIIPPRATQYLKRIEELATEF
jgi:hypothetical protein